MICMGLERKEETIMKTFDVLAILLGWGLMLGGAGGIENESIGIAMGGVLMLAGLVLNVLVVCRLNRRGN